MKLFLTKNIKNRLIASDNPLVQVPINHGQNYATPANLNYFWSFGSLVGLFFAFQIISGIILAAHYTAHTDLAFASVDHIMVDVKNGYLARYAHANGASMIFILLYLHIARNLYYQSYITRSRLWYSGIVIFLLMMATAFIGYVLPWGQMSFWGATVITNLVTAVPFVGEDIAYWIWGGFSINNATLTRFFAVHYLLPFLIVGIILVHLVLLHIEGSSNPTVLENSVHKITFHPYFTYKDSFVLTITLIFFTILVFLFPNYLGHCDNFIPANPLVTPAHIVPEWYFTPFYAILRSCPNKIGGALGMILAILIWFILPLIYKLVSKYNHVLAPHSAIHKTMFALFVGVFLILIFLGSNPAAAPYIILSKIFTLLYFSYFIAIVPLTILFDDYVVNLEGSLKRQAKEKKK